MHPLDKFKQRMKSIGIDCEFTGNYPWVYLDKINGKNVTEKYYSEYGYTIALQGKNWKWMDQKRTFNILRKYTGRRMK